MRLHIISDLHTEFGGMPRDHKAPDCDVVILAGDISTGVVGVMWAARYKPDVPVIYVPGNHEYYGHRRYHRHLEKMKEKAAFMRAEGHGVVHVLNNEAVVIDGVRFLGATLWTDFDLFGTPHLSMMAAQREMNDYDNIEKVQQVRLRAEDTQSFHLESRFFLTETMREPFDGKTVVVTHHAPSEQSSHPRYRGSPLNPAYASRLESVICNYAPALWVHGHMHDSSDYMVCDTRVVCNPRGYVGHELNPGFDPQLVLEV